MIYQKLLSCYLHKVCYYVCTAVICCALTEDIAVYSGECFKHEDTPRSHHLIDLNVHSINLVLPASHFNCVLGTV